MLPRAAPLPTRTRGRKITRRILVDTTARRTASRLLLHAKKPDMQRARQPAGHERGHNARKKTFAMLPAEEENFYYFFLAAGSWLVLLALQVLKSS